MQPASAQRSLALLLLSVLLLAACAPATPAAQPAANPAAEKPAAAAAQGAASGQKEFKIGFGSSAGFSHIGMLTAIEELNKKGYKIEPVFFAQGELGIQAAAKGDVAMSNGTTAATLDAIQKGAPLKLLSERNANEWTIYSTASLQKCADLDGKRLAVHSAAAVSTRMVDNWLKTTCPQAKPNQLIIAGSDNRAAALQAGQIDATPLELVDGITLDKTAPGKYKRLVDFSSGLPKLSTSSNFANTEFLSKNRDVAKEVIREQIVANRKLMENPEFAKQQAIKFVPNINKETLDDVVKAYREINGFPVNGGTTPESLDFTIDFFTEAGTLKPGLKATEAADLTILEDVLKEIGKR